MIYGISHLTFVDNHLFELHSGTLDERLAAYARGRATTLEHVSASPS